MTHLSRSGFLNILSNNLHQGITGDKHAEVEKKEPDSAADAISGLHPYRGEWGQKQVMHLLRRSLWGFSPAEFARFSHLTLKETIEILLTPSPAPSPPLNNYSFDGYVDPEIPFGETWISSQAVCDRRLTKTEDILNTKRRESLSAWWIGLLLEQEPSLTEKMTLFWHNHIAVEFPFVCDALKCYSYITCLRSNSLGNYKKLLFDTVTDTSMLVYLSNDLSTAQAPNENLARELQELFTVGKEKGSHYTQDDVIAAARVLTGWTSTHRFGGHTVFLPHIHDTGDKVFSAFYGHKVIKGRSGPSGGDELAEMIDMIFSVREVSRHLCRSLYRWFVFPQIDQAIEANIIEPLSDILIESNFEVTPVLRALLGSEHFFDDSNIGCLVKNPVDYLIGLSKQFKVTDFSEDVIKQARARLILSAKLERMSMCPGYPPNVAGWPAYYVLPAYSQLWLNTDTLVARYTALDGLLSLSGLSGESTDIKLHLDVLAFTAALPDPADIQKLIIDSSILLGPVDLKSEDIDFYQQILSADDKSGNAWKDVWQAYTIDPNNQTMKDVVIDRLRQYYLHILKRDECQLT